MTDKDKSKTKTFTQLKRFGNNYYFLKQNEKNSFQQTK